MYTRFSYIQGAEAFISYSTFVYATVKIIIVGLQVATLILQNEYILAAAEYNLIVTINIHNFLLLSSK